jgi:hypothetical protein
METAEQARRENRDVWLGVCIMGIVAALALVGVVTIVRAFVA